MSQITIKDFATERRTSYNAITQFLYRRKKYNEKNGVKNEKLTIRNGVKVIDTDSELYALLDKKYPLPSKSVEISQNEDLIALYKELNETHKKLESEQLRNEKLLAQVAQLQIVQKQLEDSTTEKNKAIADCDAYKEEAIQSKVREEEAQKRAESAEKKIDRMNNATLWNRIRKKW